MQSNDRLHCRDVDVDRRLQNVDCSRLYSLHFDTSQYNTKHVITVVKISIYRIILLFGELNAF